MNGEHPIENELADFMDKHDLGFMMFNQGGTKIIASRVGDGKLSITTSSESWETVSTAFLLATAKINKGY